MSRMNKPLSALAGAALIAVLAACGAVASAPTVPAPTSAIVMPNIVLPTATSAAQAGAPASTAESTPFDLGGVIKGTPVSDWKGIPIMPGATGGGETGGLYVFTTKVAEPEVVAYYAKQMQSLGFEGSATNATPAFGTIYSMVFNKGQDKATINILLQPGMTVVMISK